MSLVSSTSTATKTASISLPSLIGHAEKILNEPTLTTEKQEELAQVTEKAYTAAKSKLSENTPSETEFCIQAILLHGRALLAINKIDLLNIKSICEKNSKLADALFQQDFTNRFQIPKPHITSAQAIEIEYFNKLYESLHLKRDDSALRKIQKNPITPHWIQEGLIRTLGEVELGGIEKEYQVFKPKSMDSLQVAEDYLAEILKENKHKENKQQTKISGKGTSYSYGSLPRSCFYSIDQISGYPSPHFTKPARTSPASKYEASKICSEIFNESGMWELSYGADWFWRRIVPQLGLTKRLIPLPEDISDTRAWIKKNIEDNALDYAQTSDPVIWRSGFLKIFDQLVERAGWKKL